MQIKRNYSQAFFRERPRRRWWLWILMAIIAGGVIALGYRLLTRPQEVITDAYAIVQTVSAPMPTPTTIAETLVEQARDQYWQGDLEIAADTFAAVIAQRPDNLNYLYEYGQILIDLDRPEEAQTLAERINAESPGDVRGMALRARSLVWMGDSTAAIPVALAGIQTNNRFAPLYAALSRAYINTARWRDGLDAGELAIDLAPDDVRAHWAYAYALRSVGARDEAITQLERTIELHPGFVPPYLELAFLYMAIDRDQEAIDMYDLVLGMQPRNARALLRQCDAYRKIGEFERALGRCEDAVNADPEYTTAQYRLGVLRYNRREFEGARQAFQACADLDSGNLECKYRLGLANYYVAQDTLAACTTQGLDAEQCGHTVFCDAAWDILQDSLLMAQVQPDSESVIETIRTGLTAISDDPTCPGFSAMPVIPTPESTPDPT